MLITCGVIITILILKIINISLENQIKQPNQIIWLFHRLYNSIAKKKKSLHLTS